MDASEVEMENAEKLPVDLAKGKNDLLNSKQKGDHKQQDEMCVEDQNSCKELLAKDQTKIENGADHQSHSRGNDPNEILEEKNPEKNAMEEEKGPGEDSMEEEKNSDENLQQFTELPPDGEAEANKSEKGGLMVYEPNEKSAVTAVTTDGDAGPSEMSENEDEADRNAMAENKDAADQVEPVTPYDVVKYNSEKPKDDSEDINGTQMTEEEETGTPEDQAEFMKELESFYRERSMDFKAPKFYGQILNCLKLYRAVTRLGGYDRVTGLKLWRQVGESFHPPKTCTTVSWTFRIFYEKALLEYERHKLQNGELQLALTVVPEPVTVENETPGSGRARRDAAARAMQGWHAQRHYGYGEVGEPIIKDKNLNNMPKREKNLKSIGSLKHKRQSEVEHPVKAARTETSKQLVTTVVDVGPPADWVKINVRESKDCFEVYALVPGLLREEVRVQSDPAGRLVITGQPEQLENPWGITAFKKVVSLPARIDPLQTSAVVSLHGRLFVRVPFEQSNI